MRPLLQGLEAAVHCSTMPRRCLSDPGGCFRDAAPVCLQPRQPPWRRRQRQPRRHAQDAGCVHCHCLQVGRVAAIVASRRLRQQADKYTSKVKQTCQQACRQAHQRLPACLRQQAANVPAESNRHASRLAGKASVTAPVLASAPAEASSTAATAACAAACTAGESRE